MNQNNNPHLKPFAQKLRREMTREERHLWYDFLKSLPVTVNRQKVIGSYIVDFYIASAKLVIELDGSQHYTRRIGVIATAASIREEAGIASDRERDQALQALGLRVLRFSNADVNQNFPGVCEEIARHI